MEQLILAVIAVVLVFAITFVAAAFRRISRWNRSYEKLRKRYGGKASNKGRVSFGVGLSKPSLSFDYGRTFCSLRNRKSFRSSTGRSTELSMIWPEKKFKLEVSTSPPRNRSWGSASMKQVHIDARQFQSDFYVSSNKPLVAKKFLNQGVQWQLEKIRRHMDNYEVGVSLSRGALVVSKPGYIKDHQALEDFVRYALELFDQMMLVDAEGIAFVNENHASIVDDVKCPICSEEIMHEMVVCTRCKTPHCRDCWQYNGQCATFACSETRFVQTGIAG